MFLIRWTEEENKTLTADPNILIYFLKNCNCLKKIAGQNDVIYHILR